MAQDGDDWLDEFLPKFKSTLSEEELCVLDKFWDRPSVNGRAFTLKHVFCLKSGMHEAWEDAFGEVLKPMFQSLYVDEEGWQGVVYINDQFNRINLVAKLLPALYKEAGLVKISDVVDVNSEMRTQTFREDDQSNNSAMPSAPVNSMALV